MEYPLSLALFDFLPVLFAGIGFQYMIRLVSHVLPAQAKVAFWGSVLVVAGGFSRALWKLMMAQSGGGVNLPWLENALFVLMAPGYILLAWSFWQMARSAQGKRTFNPWIAPAGMIVVMFLVSLYLFTSNASSPAWERLLLTMMVLASLVTGILLIVFAFRLKLYLAGGLFLVNLVIIFVMNGMARLPELPVSLHWFIEGINSVAWLAFAIGARIVYAARLHSVVDPVAPSSLRSPIK